MSISEDDGQKKRSRQSVHYWHKQKDFHGYCNPRTCKTARELYAPADIESIKAESSKIESATAPVTMAESPGPAISDEVEAGLSERSPSPVTSGNAVPSSQEFGPTGTDLWREITKNGPIGPLAAILLVEACRIADRLDQLDVQLKGGDWIRFHWHGEEQEIRVVINRPLAEAREQATALRGLISEIRAILTKKDTSEGANKPSLPMGVASLREQAMKRRK